MAAIHLKNIAHSYLPSPTGPDDYALKELDHIWEDGGAYALLGPSGCGKTTLLNIISGLLKPSKGRVLFGDVDVTDVETASRNIAQVFQFPVIYDTMTVRDNLAFPLRNRGVSKADTTARVDEVAAMLGITDRLDAKAADLSADMKQIISLGRGLVRSDVNAILFDEPLTVIDPHMKWVLRTKLKELHRQFGFTMVYVTHDQTEALTFADKVVVMHDGEVVQIGTPEELFAKPAHTFVGYFIGSPGMNVLPAVVHGNAGNVAGSVFTLTKDYGDLGGNNIELGIRPEFLSIVSAEEADIPVNVIAVEDLGRHMVVRCTLGVHDIVAVVPEGTVVQPGVAGLKYDAAHAHIYRNSRLIEGCV